MSPGSRVSVHVRFDGSWSRGFEIAEAGGDSYTLRRISDGEVLPHRFHRDDVRPTVGR